MSRGRPTRLSILIYHRVHASTDAMAPDEVDAQAFDWQMQCLREYFCVLPLDEAVELLREKRLPPGAVSVTFDDGYRDNFDVALPILARHGICATFFIATGYLGSGIMFNDIVIESLRRTQESHLDLEPLGLGSHALAGIEGRRAAVREILRKLKYTAYEERARKAQALARIANVTLPEGLMLTEAQVQELHRAGMRIGAHTRTHPILALTSPQEASMEIAESKRMLESLIGMPVTLFAYPNGKPGVDYGAHHVAVVREHGFSAAVSTAAGIASEGGDLYQLPRFTPWDRSPSMFVARLIRNSLHKDVACA